MAGVKGMHKKAQVTKDETLTVAARSNGIESETNRTIRETKAAVPETAHEEKFLSDMLAGYAYWNKQPGNLAKSYAAAYKTLLNEFTAEESEKWI